MPLPDDSLEKWKYKEHTKVKHEILSKYLAGWITILGKFHDLNIFDCFAGRGRFSEGEEGSPLIIIKTLADVREKMKRPNEACCIFIEKNDSNFENLKVELEKERESCPQRYCDWLAVEYYCDEFANVALEIIETYGKKLAPSFFFLDPFGFSGIPFEVIKHILSIQRTEVFITFMIRDVNRFLKSSKHRISIEELYGVDNAQNILQSEYPDLTQEQALLKFYRDRLHEDANVNYTLPYKVNADEKLQTTYYLIHATNHPLGCELMKEIMYKVGSEGRFGYFGPAEGQKILTQYDDLSKLKDFLLDRFSRRTLSYQKVRYETLMDTYSKKRHYHDALLELEEENKIEIIGKGPRGGLRDNSRIKFS
jgi:three-Cys-motif partner protein